MKSNFDTEKHINEIAKYIIEKYPQSCLSQNSENKTNWELVSTNSSSLSQSKNK